MSDGLGANSWELFWPKFLIGSKVYTVYQNESIVFRIWAGSRSKVQQVSVLDVTDKLKTSEDLATLLSIASLVEK